MVDCALCALVASCEKTDDSETCFGKKEKK
jgi:hypothetical protein